MQMMGNKQNPQQLMGQLMGSNPMLVQAQKMCAGKSNDEIMNTIKNLCNQKGIDVDSAFQQFQAQMGATKNGIKKLI